jgi:hypothetical protein
MSGVIKGLFYQSFFVVYVGCWGEEVNIEFGPKSLRLQSHVNVERQN